MYIIALIKALRLNFLFKVNSFIWKVLLQINNIKVGKNFYIEGSISLNLKGSQKTPITISDQVTIIGNLDLRTRENGQIHIKRGVKLDTNIRLVAAKSAIISIGDGTKIGCNTIVNAGANVLFNDNCLVGANCNINSSDHVTDGRGDLLTLGYRHESIRIDRGTWLGTNVVILPGVKVGKGVVIGASSVVTKDIPDYAISVGIPAKVIRVRE